MQYFFDDLELPNLASTQLARHRRNEERARRLHESRHAREHRTSCARCAVRWRGALRSAAPRARQMQRDESATGRAARPQTPTQREIAQLKREIATTATAAARDSFHRPVDLRYRNRVRRPSRSQQGRDVLPDGRVRLDGRGKKDLAKRFFTLLYLFLTRNYEKIEARLHPPHTTTPRKSTKTTFFHSTRDRAARSCLSALELMHKIMQRALSPSANGTSMPRRRRTATTGRNDSRASAASFLPRRCCRRCAITPMSRCADAEQNLWDEYAQRARASPEFRDAKGRTPARHLSGVPRTVQETRRRMTHRRLPQPATASSRKQRTARARRARRRSGPSSCIERPTTRGDRAEIAASDSGSTPIPTSSRSSPPSR